MLSSKANAERVFCAMKFANSLATQVSFRKVFPVLETPLSAIESPILFRMLWMTQP